MKHLGIKKPPDYGQEVTQMFSQRNNPYCDLLSSISNIQFIGIKSTFLRKKYSTSTT